MERSDVVPGRGETIVYNIGTLYGEWPDGTPFEGNRYVDRFVVRGGKIVQMDVWNDSAERAADAKRHRCLTSADGCPLRDWRCRSIPCPHSAQNILEVAVLLGSRNDQRAAGNRLEMLFHHRGGARDIARGQRRDDRAMLVDGAFR